MQQPPPMISMAPSSFPPANLTTEQIQKYLDENKKLILAILDNQNLGKLAECAQYQALLQKNLMYLAAIADAQPQTPSPPVQVAPHPATPQGGFYMQHPQAAAMSQQQPGVFSPKMPIQFNNPHLMQEQQQQQQQLHQHHQQVIQAQMGNRSGGPREIAPQGGGNGGPPMTSVQNDRSKQDARDAGRSNADGQGGPAGLTSGAGSEEAK